MGIKQEGPKRAGQLPWEHGRGGGRGWGSCLGNTEEEGAKGVKVWDGCLVNEEEGAGRDGCLANEQHDERYMPITDQRDHPTSEHTRTPGGSSILSKHCGVTCT